MKVKKSVVAVGIAAVAAAAIGSNVITPQQEEVVTTETQVVEEVKQPETQVEEVVEVVEEPVVNEDGTYSYWVNFLNCDGSVLQRSAWVEGTIPTYDEDTPKYGNDTFIGWDKSMSVVTGTQTYVAQYNKYVAPTVVVEQAPKVVVVEPVVVANLKYDGTEQELITAGSGATFTYSLNSGEYSVDIPKAKDAGDYVINYKKDGVDAGTLNVSIAKRDVIITADSVTQPYSGATVMVWKSTITGDGFVEGEGIKTYSISSGRTNVGTSPVTFKNIKYKDGTNIDNYNISLVDGVITITKRPITITSGSDSKEYDGIELINPNITSDNLVSGQTIQTIMTGSITNVGTAQNTFTATIKKGTTDVTNNYEITYVYGTLTVTPSKLNILNKAGTEYITIEYLQGMTWEEWFASEYNTISACMNTGESFMISAYGNLDILKTDLVGAESSYQFYKGPLC